MERHALALLCVAVLLAGCPQDTTTTTTTTTSTTTTTLADTSAPATPGGVTATPTSCSAVRVAWNAATDTGGSGLEGYDVRRDGTLVAHLAAPATSLDDGGRAATTQYAYTVAAVDHAGNRSAASAVASALTPACANQRPVAHAGPDAFTLTLVPVAFAGNASSDADGTIVAYAWTFGDGTSASGVSVSHAYARAGTYTATLTVTDNGGLTASDTVLVSVTNRPPVANAGPDQSGVPASPVAFSGGASSDPDGTIASFAWTFGDGATASGATVAHAYAAAGTYTATLTVTDDAGGRASDTATVTVGGTWSRSFGSPGEDRAQGVAVDPNGNVALAGYFSGTVDFGTGPLTSAHYEWLDANAYKDAFVARYTPAGTPIWSRRFGAEADDRAYAVAVDPSGNVAVTGSVSNDVDFGDGVITSTAGSNDVFVALYAAADGRHLWSRRFSSTGSETGYGIAVDAAGNVIVVGTFQGSLDLGGGTLTSAGGALDQDLFVAKYSPSGAHRWSKRFGGTAYDYGYGVAVDAAGDVLVTGGFYGTVGFGGTALVSAGGYDAYLVKLRGADGTHVWSRRFGDTTDDYGYGVTVDASGNATATGAFHGTVDFGGGALVSAGGQDCFVASYSPTNAYRWSRRAGGAGDDGGRGIAVAANGDVVVTGAFQGAVDFGGGSLTAVGGGDLFTARYASSTGAHQSSHRFGGLGYQYGAGIGLEADGNAMVAGYFQNTVDFGTGPHTAAGLYDGFLARLVP